LTERLAKGKFEIVDEGLKNLWEPDAEAVDTARSYGKAFVAKIGGNQRSMS